MRDLTDPNINLVVIAVMLKRLGGTVTITQADVDAVAFNTVEDTMILDGDSETCIMQLALCTPKANG